MVQVPDSHDMEDEVFRMHLEKRHIPAGDFADLEEFYGGQHFVDNRPAIETYHDRLHDRSEEYDHEHRARS